MDPLPFVNQAVKPIPNVPAKELNGFSLQLIKTPGSGKSSSVKVNTLFTALGVVSNGYLAESPDGEQMILPFNTVKAIKNAEAPVPAIKARQNETRQARRRS